MLLIMNKTQLEYALALKKYVNYSRAAKNLGITQPALSLQIKNLETAIGVQLFDRSTKPLSVTHEGEKFLIRASQVVSQFAQLESFAQSLRDDFAGEITIGIIPTLSPYLVPLFIGSLRSEYPLLHITIKEAITEQIIEEVRAGDIQLGIVATPIESEVAFAIEPLFYESFELFVADDHRLAGQTEITLDKIRQEELWLLKEGNCFRDQVNNICGFKKGARMDQQFQYESNSIEALCRIVEHQGGVTFIPALSTMHLSEDRLDMVKKIAGHIRVREISTIAIPNASRRRFFDVIRDSIRSNIPKRMLSRQSGEVINTSAQM